MDHAVLQRKIDHRVRSHNHGIRAVFEFTDNPGKDAIIDIKIVGIQLNRIPAALWGVNGQIPAAADSEILTDRHDVHKA